MSLQLDREDGMSMYAVRKRRGAWTICDDQKLLMLLDNYEEALEVAQTAAAGMIEAAPAARCRFGSPHNLEAIDC
jgi:hypothetical protein